MIAVNGDEVTVFLPEGGEKKWQVYFFFVSPKTGKTLYFLYEASDPEGLVLLGTKDGKVAVDLTKADVREAERTLAAFERVPLARR